jgi:hypothetical protein
MTTILRHTTLCMAAALSLACVSCNSTDSSVPDAARLDEIHATIRQKSQYYYTRIDEQRARGELSDQEYAVQKDKLDEWIWEQARDSAWRQHNLAESDRKAFGIPTPDAPQQVSINPGNAGIGTGGGGSFYQPYNQSYGLGNGMANPMSGSGYVPGSNASRSSQARLY